MLRGALRPKCAAMPFRPAPRAWRGLRRCDVATSDLRWIRSRLSSLTCGGHVAGQTLEFKKKLLTAWIHSVQELAVSFLPIQSTDRSLASQTSGRGSGVDVMTHLAQSPQDDRAAQAAEVDVPPGNGGPAPLGLIASATSALDGAPSRRSRPRQRSPRRMRDGEECGNCCCGPVPESADDR